MAQYEVLAAIVLLVCLQQSSAYIEPGACKTMPWAITPEEVANETDGNCFDTKKEKELYKDVVTANEKLVVSQRNARKNLGKYIKMQFLGAMDASSVVGEGEADACWLVSDNHVNLYSKLWKIPVVVAYSLTKEEVASKAVQLPSKVLPFRSDVCLSPEQEVQCNTFFTQSKDDNSATTFPGQMLSPGHFKSNQSALLNTYVLSSVVPSKEKLHQPKGVWEQLDKEAESLAEKYGKAYIASGPVIQHPKHPRWLHDLSGSVVSPLKLFRIFAWCKSPGTVSCDPQARVYIINKKTLERRLYSTETGDSITKIEMAIECETQLEFKFQDKEASVQAGNSRRRRATECSQIVSKPAAKEDIIQPEIPSVEETAKLQETISCESGGMKLFKGLSFKAQGAQCLAAGCLNKPFGTSYVKICSLKAATEEFAKMKPHIKAKFYVGNAGQLQGKGVIVVNSSNPKDFYYAFATSRTSLTSIMAAFGDANIKLPPVLSKIKFVGSVTVTFSSRKRKITGTTLPLGHGIQGKARVYNFPSGIIMRIDPGKVYALSIRMPVVSLDKGKVKLYNSFKKTGGPTLQSFVQIRPQLEVDMTFRAFASVLGIEDVIRMQLSGNSYEFLISGKLLRKLQGRFRIYSTSGELRNLQFRINGTLGEATKETLQNKVKAALKKAANEATSKVKAVHAEITSVAKEIEQLKDMLENSTTDASFGTKKLIETQQAVTKYQKKAKITCATTCDKVWAGCSQKVCCGRDRISKKCECYQDQFVAKCKKVPNKSCLAKNAQCVNVKAVMQERLRKAVKVRDDAEVKSAALNSTVKLEKKKLLKAESKKKSLKAKLKEVEKTYAVGLKATHDIIINSLEGNEYIWEITFDTDLDIAKTGVFPCKVKVLYGDNKEKLLKTKIDVGELTKMAKVLANLVIPGLGKYVS